jgi:hypothetical protein
MTIRMRAVMAVLLLVPALTQAELFGGSDEADQRLEPNGRITLPQGLKLRAYPMPIPGASNYRIDTGSMRIAITGIPLDMNGQPAPPRGDDQMKDAAVRGAARYRPGADNPDALPTQVKGAGWTATYVTYSAKSGTRGFVPFMGAAYQCVSSGQIATARTIFVVTVGSSGCSSAEHLDFLKALETISLDS